MTRLVPALLLACLALFGGATPAFAHTDLISSDPAKGAALPAAPTQLTLTFSEPASVDSAEISVTAPGGAKWTVGTITAQGASLLVPVQGEGPAGQYVIDYAVTALDGDVVTGQIPFTLTAPAAPPAATTPPTPTEATAPQQTSTPPSNPTATSTSTSTAASTTATSASGAVSNTADEKSGSDGGIPVWVWILGAVVLAGVGVFAVLKARRGRAGDDEEPAVS